MKVYIIPICILILSAPACCVSNIFTKNKNKIENYQFRKPVGYVNDFANILDPNEEKDLERLIINHQKKTSNQIAMVLIECIKPYSDIESYTLDLANQWGVGEKGKNNGIVIVLSTKLRKVRIQNGYGIAKIMTDEKTLEIVRDDMIPEFKKKKYYDGLKSGLVSVTNYLETKVN